MKQNRILISLTVSLLVVVSLLILYLHYAGSQAVLSEFQRDQLSYAKHLSNQIRFYFQARSRGLRALASFASFQYGDAKQQRLDIQSYAKQLGHVYVIAVSLYDEQGRVIYSTAPHTIGEREKREKWEKFFVWAKENENTNKTFLTPLFNGAKSLMFTLALPIFQDAGHPEAKTKGKFLGVLTFTLDMKGFLANQVGFKDPPMNLDQIWIVDKNGTLLFQPDHPQMVSRNIYQSDGNCEQCHASFHYVEEMLEKKQGTLDYQIKDYPQKIAAFASVEFENASWVVVVNTPYGRVTGFVKKSLRNHLLLLGIIVIAFAAGSMLVIRNERVKIKAEEEVVRWQEKMEERRKAEADLQQERNKLRESEKQLRSLSTQLLRAQETERKRISRELHDELGQSLLVMKLRLNFIEDNLLSHQIELKRECEDGIQYMDQVIENIRRLSRDLSPAILEDFGLSAALRWLINNFAKRYNMKVMIDMLDIDSLLPLHSHIVVYRTVQEVLTNIGKHSQAKNVSVSISENTDNISFSIADDGIGFDEGLIDAKDLEARGLGLETMKGRCRMVGGVLKILTKEGEGTRITLSVPVERGTT
jgi:signal transduction histidine kinase